MIPEPVDTSLVVRIKVGHQPRYFLALLWVGLLLLALVLIAPQTNLVVYVLVALVGGGLSAFAFLVMPQFTYLELNRTGFVVRNFRVAREYRWRDVEHIKVFEWQNREVIGVNFSADVQVKGRVENQNKWSWDLVLTSHYELAPQEIVDMMNAYRLGH